MAKSSISNGIKRTQAHGPSKTNMDYTKYYLIAYNLIQTIGPTTKSLYDTISFPLHVFQNAAVFEVVHAATGIVKSNAVLTAFQVASRVVVVCGILLATFNARLGLGLPLALLAWCITEIVRYSNYTLNLIGNVPYILKYLRYTMFIVLYPIGITGELLCIWKAQEEVGKGFLYSVNMPNKYNFIFNYQHLLWFLMLLYIPLFPQLYLHMFGQRKKALGTNKNKIN
ncbi:hypothetical protein ABEB36_002792 [Hypothenemus hampei]|uniref:Very-long-chain (3R)-3-hydroxyacyl-CoA dehydratase n=1 Tax=Hypothenemus hampei TaxID=57062 RepID=A0ABD1F7C2_HYPHA